MVIRIAVFLKRTIPGLRRFLDGPWGNRLNANLKFFFSSAKEEQAYREWRGKRLDARRETYANVRPREGIFSFLTTVYDTPVEYMSQLVESLEKQTVGICFEWIVLDNGSRKSDVIEFVRKLGEKNYVRYFRVEQNLGIVKGMRVALEKASNRYVIPLDSDDLLTDDCLAILLRYIERNDPPALLYTDEDHIIRDEFCAPYLKPDWDPVLFVNSCYIAHLCAIDRELGLKLEMYSDSLFDGSHDWDTFSRFMLAGYRPLHVPEVVYSWRMHPGSASLNIGGKPYVIASQQAVIDRFIHSRPHPERFSIEHNSMFDHMAVQWRIYRKPECPAPLLIVSLENSIGAGAPEPVDDDYGPVWKVRIHTDMNLSVLREIVGSWIAIVARESGGSEPMIAFLAEGVEISAEAWAYEALGQFELFDEIAAICGQVCAPDGAIVSTGEYFGYAGMSGCPDRELKKDDLGPGARLKIHHTVDCVSPYFWIARWTFLKDFLTEPGCENKKIRSAGIRASLFARERGKRTIFTPFIQATVSMALPEFSSGEKDEFGAVLEQEIANYPVYYSPWFGRERGQAYIPVLIDSSVLNLGLDFGP